MWLRNDILKVFFDERRGGMPTADSFGFIRAASVEIARAWPPPFSQSLNERNPHIKKHGASGFATSGAMKRGGKTTPHTYEMTATLEGNRLDLSYRLNAARTESVIRSKIWLFASPLLSECEISGKIMHKALRKNPVWEFIYEGEQPRDPITLLGPNGTLGISGSTTPPVRAVVSRLRRYTKLEVAYEWARGTLKKGAYSGGLTLTYGR